MEFRLADATSDAGAAYDLVCFFDCLHDLGDPVAALRRAREALAENGTLMLVEPYARDAVEENHGPVARVYYSASTAICVAHSRSEEGGLALGAQAGPARLSELLGAAGFGRIRVAYESPFNIVLEGRSL